MTWENVQMRWPWYLMVISGMIDHHNKQMKWSWYHLSAIVPYVRMSATLADPSIFVDGGLRCWRPPGFFHSTRCRICKTSIIVRDKVAKRYQRASKDHLRNLRKTWGKAVHMVVHRTVHSNSHLDSDSNGMKDLWEEPSSYVAHEIQASGAHRRSPNLAEWFQSALTCSDETKHRHFEILQIHNSLYPWNNAWTITAMLGYTAIHWILLIPSGRLRSRGFPVITPTLKVQDKR